jgi:succinoglycan biosynthesis protein ExoA
MTASIPDPPSVTLVVPIRNESRDIDRCLEALTGQGYPRERLQIIVVDGASTDDTLERVAAWMARDERIVLLTNPDQLMAIGLNLGINASEADVVGVISGHSSVEPDYVQRAVDALQRTGAWCVGARVARESSTPVQRAIARAASSPIGVGDSRHNYAKESGWAETAFPGVWHRWVFDRIGTFDVAMSYNEDNELSHRILAAGGRIWFEASIVVHYVPRGTLGGVFTQYRRYGRGKVGVFRKHLRALRWRHLVPPAWVAWLPASAVAGLFVPAMWLALGASGAAYAALLFAASARGREPGDPVLLTGAAFAAIHAGYGIGIWQGLLDAVRRK